MLTRPPTGCFARVDFRNKGGLICLDQEDRNRHIWICGKTKLGKSTLLENLAIQDITAGHGVMFIDPHGDSAERLLDYIPSHRTWETLYFKPADVEFPIGLNVLDNVNPELRHLVMSQVISTFKSLWRDYWGPVQEQMLSYSVATLMEVGGHTLLDAPRLLTDDRWRESVVQRVQDPILEGFWRDQYDERKAEYRREAVAPILNKVSQFLLARPLRNIIGQQRPRMDLDFMRANKRVLIANLAGIGRQEGKLLGNLLVAKLFLLASNVPHGQRVPFYLYIDEVGSVATHILEDILSEARKYMLGITIAHQYLAQLEKGIPEAIFGNVGTMIVFGIGAHDAEVIGKEFAPEFSPLDLVSLGKYRVAVKLSHDGVTSRPFSGRTLPPDERLAGRKEQVIRSSRERFAIRREEVERKLLQ